MARRKRPTLPAELKRRVLVESGHRCAIPTCKQPTIEIAHIEPYEKVLKHEFPNLIALCPNCHTRYDSGQIDRKSILQYKANLSILNSRYGEFERRVLTYFALVPEQQTIRIGAETALLVMYLLVDKMLEYTQSTSGAYSFGVPTWREARLTERGMELVERVRSGLSIEALS